MRVRARANNLPAAEVRLDIYDSDPKDGVDENGGAVVEYELGKWFRNGKNRAMFDNSYRDDMCLKDTGDDDYLDGKWFGVRCEKSGKVVGSCEIQVREIGDHADPDDEDDEDEEATIQG